MSPRLGPATLDWRVLRLEEREEGQVGLKSQTCLLSTLLLIVSIRRITKQLEIYVHTHAKKKEKKKKISNCGTTTSCWGRSIGTTWT